MKIMYFKSALCFLFMLLAFTNCAKGEQELNRDSAGGTPPPRPNIIFIVGETHRADALSVAGHPVIRTPNLDQMANAGIRFSQAYVTTAICAVSRASILSGQHRARHGINDFQTGFTEEAFRQTFPLVLKEEGYALAWIGSYGVGTPPFTTVFDLWEPRVPWMEDGVHNTDNVVNKANTWLENRKSEEPFYMQLNFSAAHEIDPTTDRPAYFLVQERFQSMYTDAKVSQPTSADPAVWEAFPDFFRTDDNIARKRWYGFFDTPEIAEKSAKDYYRMLTGVDDAVGRLQRKLKELGLDENTIIVYTSDHGFSLGEHGMMGKWYPFQPSIQIPLIIYNPMDKSGEGREISSIALNIDIAPTILGMAGADVPARMQGQDLIRTMDDKVAERSQFFYEHTVFKTPQMPAVEAIVSKDFKYIKFVEHGYELLYDLKNDPDEITSLVENADYIDDLQRMRMLYEEERAAAR